MGALFGRLRGDSFVFTKANAAYPDISIPEGLHTLAHGPRKLKVAAAGALCEIVNGEVQVLEEILDEAKCVHVPVPADGRNIFTVLIDELSLGAFAGAEVLATFIERCTAYDTAWDDEDEWNQQVLQVHEFLKECPGAVSGLARAKAKQYGAAASLLGTVLLRLQGDRKAVAEAVAEAVAVPLWRRLFSLLLWLLQRLGLGRSPSHIETTLPAPPEVMSVNTRVQCAVSGKYTTKPVVCPKCKDANYCSEEHLKSDAVRHGTWCFEPRGIQSK